MKRFIKINKYGDLYVDRILFESYFPIIFTCRDANNDIFICVCCQNNREGCKWLVGKTDKSSIIKMLKDEITIRDLLLNFSSEKISVDYIDGKYVVSYRNSDWNEDSIYLPKKDSYMYVEEGEFDDDIIYFSVDDHINYDEESYVDIKVPEIIHEVISNNSVTNANNCIHKKEYEIKFCRNLETSPNDSNIPIEIDDCIANAA